MEYASQPVFKPAPSFWACIQVRLHSTVTVLSAGLKVRIGHLARAATRPIESLRPVRASEANLRAAIENMVEGIIMISVDGKVALHNQRVLKIFGLQPMNAVGMPRAEFSALLVEALKWPQSAQEYLQKQLASVRADGNYRIFDVDLPNNRVLRYSASLMPDGAVMSYIEDISEQRAAAASIMRLAHYDTLTDLPNRALFQERLLDAVAATELSSDVAASLLLCNLDRFKAVNDMHGHAVGDELLRQAVRRMRDNLRNNGLMARLGADEFAIIHLGMIDGAEWLAKRVIACLEQPFEIQGHEISIGASVGIATAPADASTADELMQKAGIALYFAKRGGRNMHRSYDLAMAAVTEEHLVEIALRKAIANKELHLNYQPQVDMKTRRIVGFEALARWNHPERGAISPGVFIPLAEKTGLVVALGEWAMRQACTDAAQWRKDTTIAVNVAPPQLMAEGFVDMVCAVLAESGLAPHRLEIEITESTPLEDDTNLLATLHELKAMGIRFAMDDFGTGNSTLSYLHKFPFDKIKVDQSFVRNLGRGREADAIVQAVMGLASTLKVKTVAEGVETEQHASILESMGCAIGQGWLYGRPVPAHEANTLAARTDTPPLLLAQTAAYLTVA